MEFTTKPSIAIPVDLRFSYSLHLLFSLQANGWGFRRITQGRDRNAYYHPRFLRGLPHLCKNMRRPGVNQKKASDPNEEPDLYEISRSHPVPERAEDDSILLHNTVQNGPRARMPIYCGAFSMSTTNSTNTHKMPSLVSDNKKPATTNGTPHDQMALNMFAQSMATTETQVRGSGSPMNISPASAPKPVFNIQPNEPPQQQQNKQPNFSNLAAAQGGNNNFAALAAANQMAMSVMPSFGNNAAAASQFAAGFAAAAAFSQQHFSTFLQSMQQQQR